MFSILLHFLYNGREAISSEDIVTVQSLHLIVTISHFFRHSAFTTMCPRTRPDSNATKKEEIGPVARQISSIFSVEISGGRTFLRPFFL